MLPTQDELVHLDLAATADWFESVTDSESVDAVADPVADADTAPPSPAGARPDLASRRDTIRSAAVDAIRVGGSGVSMDAIAAAAGTTKPSVYRVFGSKPDLYAAVADWFIGELLSDIVAMIDPETPLQDFIRSSAACILDRVAKDRNVYDFLMRRARMQTTSVGAHGYDFLHDLGDHAGALIGMRLAETGRDPTPAPILGHAVVGMINSVADWWTDHPEVEQATVLEHLSSMLWSGFSRYSTGAG